MRSKHSRSAILGQSAALLLVILMSSQAFAMPHDIIGGPGSDAQTVSHCGVLRAEHMVYTHNSRNTKILQRKLTKLGYFRGAIDGKNSPWFKTAVAKFQFDYGLKIDGVIGQETATAIAYVGHPLSNVRACKRVIEQATL
jgi:hypothetical protein